MEFEDNSIARCPCWLLADRRRGEGLGIPAPHHGCHAGPGLVAGSVGGLGKFTHFLREGRPWILRSFFVVMLALFLRAPRLWHSHVPGVLLLVRQWVQVLWLFRQALNIYFFLREGEPRSLGRFVGWSLSVSAQAPMAILKAVVAPQMVSFCRWCCRGRSSWFGRRPLCLHRRCRCAGGVAEAGPHGPSEGRCGSTGEVHLPLVQLLVRVMDVPVVFQHR